jgi:hypothetical protein
MYLALGSVPLFYVIYSMASTPGDNFLTRLVKRYEDFSDTLQQKEALHTTMIEQAAADRQFFAGAPPNKAGPPLRYPE